MILGLILILLGLELLMAAAFWDICRNYCLTAHRQDSLPADLPEDDDEEPDPTGEPSDLPLG